MMSLGAIPFSLEIDNTLTPVEVNGRLTEIVIERRTSHGDVVWYARKAVANDIAAAMLPAMRRRSREIGWKPKRGRKR